MEQKNQRLLKLLCFLLTAALLLTLLLLPSVADFGDFGGGDDYGGDWGGGDWGGGDYGGWGNDYYGGGTYYSDGDDGPMVWIVVWAILSFIVGAIGVSKLDKGKKMQAAGKVGAPSVIFGIILMIISAPMSLLILFLFKNGKTKGGGSGPRIGTSAVLTKLDIEEHYRTQTGDAYFREEDIRAQLTNFLIRYLESVNTGDFEALEPLFTDNCYGSQIPELQEMRKHVAIRVPSVLSSALTAYTVGSEMNGPNPRDTLTGTLDVKYVVENKLNGETQTLFRTFTIVLSRATGLKTPDREAEGNGVAARKVCPKCGAPLISDTTCRCEYCNEVIDTNPNGWKVSDVKSTTTTSLQKGSAVGAKDMSSYKSVDPTFDETAFCERLKQLYVRMQNSWENRNLEPVRADFTPSYFAQMEKQSLGYLNAGRTPHVEDIRVDSVVPLYYTQDAESDTITVSVRTRVVLYTTDDKTGKIVAGSRNEEKHMEYEWDLIRKRGKGGSEGGEGKTCICPGCGAAVEMNSGARCPYCGSILTSGNTDWALCAIRGISQRTYNR